MANIGYFRFVLVNTLVLSETLCAVKQQGELELDIQIITVDLQITEIHHFFILAPCLKNSKCPADLRCGVENYHT